MRRIEPIDLYKKDFFTLYGIDLGEYYEVTEGFFIEIVDEYKIQSENHGISYLQPQWTRIRTVPGDLIVVNQTDAYLLPKDEEFFIPCKPESNDLKFDRFPPDFLEKIGKEITRGHAMGMEDRKKFTLSRIL